jgi:hypothetical protein
MHIVAKGQKFTVPVPSGIRWQKELIDKARFSIRRPGNIIRNPDDDKSYIYGLTDYRMGPYGRTWRDVYFDPAKRECARYDVFIGKEFFLSEKSS